jgi:hypothetical protein
MQHVPVVRDLVDPVKPAGGFGARPGSSLGEGIAKLPACPIGQQRPNCLWQGLVSTTTRPASPTIPRTIRGYLVVNDFGKLGKAYVETVI